MKKLLLIALSILIFFACGELLCRAFYPQSQYSVTYAPWGWRHIPNTSVTFYGEKQDWRWKLKPTIMVRYNNKGLRSDIDQGYGRWACPRILILGDSFAEDMGSRYNNLHTTYLRNLTRGEVINAGHYGFCNAQELMYYLDVGQRFWPDIVIIFYAQDTANPTYAGMIDGNLVLKWKTFTWQQKTYKNIVSLIRLHSQFGSFILNRLERISFVNKVVIQKGLSEHIPVTNLASARIGQGEFAPIDKEIWRQFKYLTDKNGSKLVIMNCMGNFTPEQESFFDSIGILHFGITGLPNPDKQRQEDKANRCYDPQKESHRFGYKNNSLVAERIYQFLKEKNLLQ